MKNNTQSTKKYVKYNKNLAMAELTDINKAPDVIDDMGGKRAGAPLRAYSEADALIADVMLLAEAQKKEKRTGFLFKEGKIKYHCMKLSTEEFRQQITGNGVINRDSVEHVYWNTARDKSDNLVVEGKYTIKAVGFMVQKSTKNADEIKLMFPACFSKGGFFFAPSSLQAKIKNIKKQRPELFFIQNKIFEVSELLARKFFLYIGLHYNDSGTLELDLIKMFLQIRPSMFFRGTEKCRSLSSARKMLDSLISIYNEVIKAEPAACLKIIQGTEQTEKTRVRIKFAENKPKRTVQFWRFRKVKKAGK